MSRIIKCECCGVEFEAKTNNAKLCSRKCMYRSWAKKNPEKIKAYKPKFYSKCREKTANKMSRIIKCECCGVEFEANSHNTKFCSRNCKYQKDKLAHKRWRQANPEKQRIYQKKWTEENLETSAVRKRKTAYKQLGYPEELLEIKELQYQIKKEIKNQLKD